MCLGCGDYKLNNISVLPDPCALPGDRATKTKQARRVLNEKERLLYAPFSGVGGIVYDKDAVYIELGGSHSHRPSNSNEKVNFKVFEYFPFHHGWFLDKADQRICSEYSVYETNNRRESCIQSIEIIC